MFKFSRGYIKIVFGVLVLFAMVVESNKDVLSGDGSNNMDLKYFTRNEIKELQEKLFKVVIKNGDIPPIPFSIEGSTCSDFLCMEISLSHEFFKTYSDKFSAFSCHFLSDPNTETIFYFGKYITGGDNLRLGRSRHTKNQLNSIVDCIYREFK